MRDEFSSSERRFWRDIRENGFSWEPNPCGYDCRGNERFGARRDPRDPHDFRHDDSYFRRRGG